MLIPCDVKIIILVRHTDVQLTPSPFYDKYLQNLSRIVNLKYNYGQYLRQWIWRFQQRYGTMEKNTRRCSRLQDKKDGEGIYSG